MVLIVCSSSHFLGDVVISLNVASDSGKYNQMTTHALHNTEEILWFIKNEVGEYHCYYRHQYNNGRKKNDEKRSNCQLYLLWQS